MPVPDCQSREDQLSGAVVWSNDQRAGQGGDRHRSSVGWHLPAGVRDRGRAEIDTAVTVSEIESVLVPGRQTV